MPCTRRARLELGGEGEGDGAQVFLLFSHQHAVERVTRLAT